MLSLNEIIVMMGIAIGDPSLPLEKPKTVGVDPIQATCLAENGYFALDHRNMTLKVGEFRV